MPGSMEWSHTSSSHLAITKIIISTHRSTNIPCYLSFEVEITDEKMDQDHLSLKKKDNTEDVRVLSNSILIQKHLAYKEKLRLFQLRTYFSRFFS